MGKQVASISKRLLFCSHHQRGATTYAREHRRLWSSCFMGLSFRLLALTDYGGTEGEGGRALPLEHRSTCLWCEKSPGCTGDDIYNLKRVTIEPRWLAALESSSLSLAVCLAPPAVCSVIWRISTILRLISSATALCSSAALAI